jgi:UDP-2,3-diacylglucosamine hydrolase
MMSSHITASPDWECADLVSDLHLQASTPQTAQTWHHYLAQAQCDALFILGDFFEVWVGDDVLDTAQTDQLSSDNQRNAIFWQTCTEQLRAASQRMQLYMIVGNRDFLLGPRFFQASGVTPLAEETVLDWHGHRYLLAHGDRWCTSDQAYQAFRAQVRSPQWQQAFLKHNLSERLAQAQAMRDQSSQRMQAMSASNQLPDVTASAVAQSAALAQATTVIHGHTHTGLDHAMAHGLTRHVLSDWDTDHGAAHGDAAPRAPRAQLIRLSRATPGDTQRINLATA